VTTTNSKVPASQVTSCGDAKAIRHLKQAIAKGKHWYIALLEAIGLCDMPKETCNGYTYYYLVADEAFDWLLLAERLCQAVDGLLPNDEKARLLFYAKPPLNLPTERFKELIGNVKYRQYELKEFTYWLFKYRLKHCDKARVASDTKKALNWLNRNGFSSRPEKHELASESTEVLPPTP